MGPKYSFSESFDIEIGDSLIRIEFSRVTEYLDDRKSSVQSENADDISISINGVRTSLSEVRPLGLQELIIEEIHQYIASVEPTPPQE